MDKSIIMEQYKRGDFKWKNDIVGGEVEFVENEQGKFLVAHVTDQDFPKQIFE